MPVFYQPTPSALQQDHQPDNPATSDEGSEEEETETQVAVSVNNRAIGRMFALKIWLWPSPNWWITGASKTSSQGACADQGDDLDVNMKKEFQGFLLIDMGMLTEDWSQPDFKREVFFLFIFTGLLLTDNWKFQAGARAF